MRNRVPSVRRARLSLCTVCACLVLASAAGAALAVEPGLDALQGVWVVTDAERQLAPLPSLKGGVLTITGDKFKLERGILDTWAGVLRLDPATGQIDFLHEAEHLVAPVKGDKWEGSYRVRGDTLEIVTTTGHDARPTAFRTGYDITLIKLRRR